MTPPRPGRPRAAAVSMLAVLAAGCGTTVSSSGATGPAAVVAGDGLSGPTASSATGAATATGAGNAGAAGIYGTGPAGGAVSSGDSAVSGSDTGIGTPATSVGGGAAAPGASSTSAPGVTATKIYVGMVYAVNGDAVNKAVGANGITSGDTQAEGNAVVDDINKHGGIAGRRVVAVWQPFDATSTQTADQQWASICDHFTNDQRVFAAIGQGVSSYRACLAKAGIVQLDNDFPDISDEEFARYPTLVELNYPRLSRVAEAQLAALAGQHYFSPWNTSAGRPGAAGKAKVGVLTYDDPAFNGPVNNVLIPGLRKLGYDPGADVARITPISTSSDYGNQAAAVQSAELKFAADHVTHVVIFEGNGGLSLFFMNQAESQHYRPRYGVNSDSGLETLISTGDVQKAQAVGAVGFGWMPSFDVTANRNPDNGPYSNPQRRQCVAMFKAHGITFSDTNAEFGALEYCATLNLLRTTLDATPRLITPSTFVNVLDRLGTSYRPATSLGNFLGRGRHDGPSSGYYWRYFTDCQCLHYTGALRSIPG